MGKSDNKTIATNADVADFVASIEGAQQRRDSEDLMTMMQEITGEPPVMWGPSIIGFGTEHYKYESGREGDMPKLAFAPRKGKLALYITYDASRFEKQLADIGKFKMAKSCIYLTKLADADEAKLAQFTRERYIENENER